MSYVWLLRNQKATFPTFGSGNSQSQSEGDGDSMCFPCKHRQLKKLLELEISSNFYTMLVVKALKFIYIHNQGSKRNIITFLRNLSFTLYLRISLNSPKTTNFITKKEKTNTPLFRHRAKFPAAIFPPGLTKSYASSASGSNDGTKARVPTVRSGPSSRRWSRKFSIRIYLDVSENSGFPPKSSILIGFSIIFTIHFGGFSPYFWKHPFG